MKHKKSTIILIIHKQECIELTHFEQCNLYYCESYTINEVFFHAIHVSANFILGLKLFLDTRIKIIDKKRMSVHHHNIHYQYEEIKLQVS